jgi:hypothetical protein
LQRSVSASAFPTVVAMTDFLIRINVFSKISLYILLRVADFLLRCTATRLLTRL